SSFRSLSNTLFQSTGSRSPLVAIESPDTLVRYDMHIVYLVAVFRMSCIAGCVHTPVCTRMRRQTPRNPRRGDLSLPASSSVNSSGAFDKVPLTTPADA